MKHIQILETIDEVTEGPESDDEASSRDGETGVLWITLFPQKNDSYHIDMILGFGIEESSKLDTQDNARKSEGSQAIEGGTTVVSDTAVVASKAKYTGDIQMEMVRNKNKDGADGCAEHKETMGDGVYIPEIKTAMINVVPRAHEYRICEE